MFQRRNEYKSFQSVHLPLTKWIELKQHNVISLFRNTKAAAAHLFNGCVSHVLIVHYTASVKHSPETLPSFNRNFFQFCHAQAQTVVTLMRHCGITFLLLPYAYSLTMVSSTFSQLNKMSVPTTDSMYEVDSKKKPKNCP